MTLQLPPAWQSLGGSSGTGWHYYSDLIACPQRSHYRHVLNIVPATTSKPLVIGSLIHLALALYYKFKLPLVESFEAMWKSPDLPAAYRAEGEQADEIKAVCLRVLTGYAETYKDDHQRYEVLAVEEVAKTTLGGFPVSCRFDLVLRDKNSYRISIIDHKTTSAMTSEFSQGFSFDGQLLFLPICWNATLGKTYGPLAAIVINALVKTRVPQFSRMTYPVASGPKLEEFKRQFVKLVRGVKGKEPIKLGLYNGACRSPYICSYLPICENGWEIVQDEYRVEKP